MVAENSHRNRLKIENGNFGQFETFYKDIAVVIEHMHKRGVLNGLKNRKIIIIYLTFPI